MAAFFAIDTCAEQEAVLLAKHTHLWLRPYQLFLDQIPWQVKVRRRKRLHSEHTTIAMETTSGTYVLLHASSENNLEKVRPNFLASDSLTMMTVEGSDGLATISFVLCLSASRTFFRDRVSSLLLATLRSLFSWSYQQRHEAALSCKCSYQ